MNDVATARSTVSSRGPGQQDSQALLLGYIRIRRDTPTTERDILKDSITAFAEREGYCLSRIFVGVEEDADLSIVGLLDDVRSSGADAVLVVGPADAAVAALRRLSGVRILTPADPSPACR